MLIFIVRKSSGIILGPIDTIWAICYAARYELDSIKGHEASCELESLLGLQYEEIEDAVFATVNGFLRHVLS